MFAMKKQTILADVRGARASVVRSGALVRVGGGGPEAFDATSPTPPSWWPKTIAWPPVKVAPEGWIGPKWPPTTLEELKAGTPPAPSWWPKDYDWPPSEVPPVSWAAGAKWPPATKEDLALGMTVIKDEKKEEVATKDTSVPSPAWWPSSLAWPPSVAPPPNWTAGVKWPPTTAMELSAGISASMTSTGPAAETAKTGMTPGQKDAVATGAGALIGGVVAKLVIGAGALTVGPIALGAVLGAMFGHAFFAMATGNPLTSVATKGCGCGGPPHPAEYPGLEEPRP